MRASVLIACGATRNARWLGALTSKTRGGLCPNKKWNESLNWKTGKPGKTQNKGRLMPEQKVERKFELENRKTGENPKQGEAYARTKSGTKV
jgi:hypothetical protein